MFKVSIQLTNSLKNLLKETAKQLKGAAKRKFIAQTVAALGHGGQLKAEQKMVLRVTLFGQEHSVIPKIVQ